MQFVFNGVASYTQAEVKRKTEKTDPEKDVIFFSLCTTEMLVYIYLKISFTYMYLCFVCGSL